MNWILPAHYHTQVWGCHTTAPGAVPVAAPVARPVPSANSHLSHWEAVRATTSARDPVFVHEAPATGQDGTPCSQAGCPGDLSAGERVRLRNEEPTSTHRKHMTPPKSSRICRQLLGWGVAVGSVVRAQ